MKLLLITLEYPPGSGGVGQYLSRLMSAAPNPEDVFVLAPEVKHSSKFDLNVPYQVFRAELMWKHGIFRWGKALFTVRKMIKANRPDCIAVSHVLPMGHVALVAKRLWKIPYVVFVHGTDILMAQKSFRKRFLARRVLKNAKMVIANSKYTASLLEAQGIKDAVVVTPCIDCIPEAVEKNVEPPVIVSVGRLVMRKGYDVAIKAIALVKKEIPGVKYFIVGDGPDKRRLEYMAKGFGVRDCVEFCGKVPDVKPYLSAATVFLHPARIQGNDVEGFGMAVIEASSHGVPVIVGDSGGTKETLKDGETGHLVKPTDQYAIARAIISLIREPERAKKMGESGKEYVRNHFLPEIIGKQFWDLINGNA